MSFQDNLCVSHELYARCIELGRELGANNFTYLTSQYLDLLSDKRPRLLIITSARTKNENLLRQLQETLAGWRVIIHDHNQEQERAFADAGLVLVRTSAPFREDEVRQVSSSWKRCFSWGAFLTHAQDIDDDDLEDVSAFIIAAFTKLTNGHRQLISVWNDLAACIQGIQANQPTIHMRSILALGELRNATTDLLGKVDTSLAESIQSEKQLTENLQQKQQMFQNTKEELASLLQSVRLALSGLYLRFGTDLADEIARVRQEILSYVESVSINDLQNQLQPLVVAQSEAAVKSVVGKIAEEIDTAVTCAKDKLLSINRSVDCEYKEVVDQEPEVNLSVAPKAELSRAQEEPVGSTIATKIRNIVFSIGPAVLVAQLLNPFTGLIAGLGVLVLFTSADDTRQQMQLRKEISLNISRYFQELSTQYQSELRKELTRLFKEILDNLECNSREIINEMQKSAKKVDTPENLKELREKIATLCSHRDKLIRTRDLINQEIARLDMIRQIENVVKVK